MVQLSSVTRASGLQRRAKPASVFGPFLCSQNRQKGRVSPALLQALAVFDTAEKVG